MELTGKVVSKTVDTYTSEGDVYQISVQLKKGDRVVGNLTLEVKESYVNRYELNKEFPVKFSLPLLSTDTDTYED